MASGPITAGQIDGEKVGTVTDFIFLGFKIMADGDCSHEINRLVRCKESYDKSRQCIKKQRHHFADKGIYSQSYVFFLVIMYRCESWTIKQGEHHRTDAFKLWCWRRLLGLPRWH